MNGYKTNEGKKRMDERTRLRLNERAKCQPNKRKMTNGTNKRPKTRQPNKWLKYTYPFSKRIKAGPSLVQNIEKRFRLGFKTGENDLIMPVEENRKNGRLI